MSVIYEVSLQLRAVRPSALAAPYSAQPRFSSSLLEVRVKAHGEHQVYGSFNTKTYFLVVL